MINIERVKTDYICYPENTDHYDSVISMKQKIKNRPSNSASHSNKSQSHNLSDLKENDIISQNSSLMKHEEQKRLIIKTANNNGAIKSKNLLPPMATKTPNLTKLGNLGNMGNVIENKSGQDSNYHKLSSGFNNIKLKKDKDKDMDLALIKLPNKDIKSIKDIKDIFKGESPIKERILERSESKELNLSQENEYPSSIICVGDSKNILKLDLKILKWKVIQLDEKHSHYTGTLRFSSLCVVYKQNLFLTGIVKYN